MSVQICTCSEKVSGQKRPELDSGPSSNKICCITTKTVDKWIAENYN